MKAIDNRQWAIGILLTIILLAFSMGPAFAEGIAPTFPGLNAQGDLLYLPKSGHFAVGAGMSFATLYDGALELRAEWVIPINEETSNQLGAGIGLNINKAVEMLGGEWALKGVTSSIGVVGLVDFVDKASIEPAFYITVLKVEF
jgi:hypothetical protein